MLRQISKSFTVRRERLLTLKGYFKRERNYCFIFGPKADHQGSKIQFRDFRLIGPYLTEKVLPNNIYLVRKLKTNKTQILHRIRPQKYDPGKPPGDNYQEAQWQIDDNIVIPQNDFYTLAWEDDFGAHLFDIPIIDTDPNAIDFEESYTQGPDTVIVPHSYFHDKSDAQNRDACTTSDPSLVYPSNPKSHGQSQDVETATDLHYNDTSSGAPESNTDIETACKPKQQPPSRQSENT